MTSLKISILPLVLGVAVSNVVMAQTDCSNYGDDSQRIEKTVDLEPALKLFNIVPGSLPAWNNAAKVEFDFGYSNIDNINELEFKVFTKTPWPLSNGDRLRFPLQDKEDRSVGFLYVVSGPGMIFDGSPYTTYERGDLGSMYDDELKQGKLKLGIVRERFDSSSTFGVNVEVKSVQVSFCGVVKDDIDSQELDAARNNLLTEQGEAVQHYLDANITYRATVTGAASDQNGNAISSVSVNYIDPRSQKNITKQFSDNQEYYLHSDGKVSLYYTNGNEHNNGGHTVTFERVNLD
ncbi:hypothetical protein GTG28_17405 [Vibrio sp. OCN044]|uniref:Uncharacterized protein n=1 Tax=Vibrio tetraodonis subsp. pristinus TaxID=2695891 RepID=A0A6L8LY09_9VIBR|nr:hypothetical protein [Vibrio tetraodonis]MYM61007.1 hypothetical protein [Vibrio tetraodonis subsp. pristinus]